MDNNGNERQVYEKPVLIKHQQLREVTLNSTGGGRPGGGWGSGGSGGSGGGWGSGGSGGSGGGWGSGGSGGGGR